MDPNSGVHTPKVENLWFLAKRRNKQESGTKREEIDSYFLKFFVPKEI